MHDLSYLFLLPHCVKVLWIYKLRNLVLSYRHFWPLNFELSISSFCAIAPSCLNFRITVVEAPWRTVIDPTCRIIQKTSMNIIQYSVTLVTNDTWYQCQQNVLQQCYALCIYYYYFMCSYALSSCPAKVQGEKCNSNRNTEKYVIVLITNISFSLFQTVITRCGSGFTIFLELLDFWNFFQGPGEPLEYKIFHKCLENSFNLSIWRIKKYVFGAFLNRKCRL